MRLPVRLSYLQKEILVALQKGSRLKVYRTIDGDKRYVLHSDNESAEENTAAGVSPADVAYLEKHHLVESNMKFPAASFLLTDRGAAVAGSMSSSERRPTGPRNFR